MPHTSLSMLLSSWSNAQRGVAAITGSLARCLYMGQHSSPEAITSVWSLDCWVLNIWMVVNNFLSLHQKVCIGSKGLLCRACSSLKETAVQCFKMDCSTSFQMSTHQNGSSPGLSSQAMSTNVFLKTSSIENTEGKSYFRDHLCFLPLHHLSSLEGSDWNNFLLKLCYLLCLLVVFLFLFFIYLQVLGKIDKFLFVHSLYTSRKAALQCKPSEFDVWKGFVCSK